MKELVCTVCPNGCRLHVDDEHGYAVTGNKCPKGIDYGRDEVLHPARVLTSTVQIEGAQHPRLPVKSDRPIARDMLLCAVRSLDSVIVRAPAVCGQIIVHNIADTGADIVASRSMTHICESGTGDTDAAV